MIKNLDILLSILNVTEDIPYNIIKDVIKDKRNLMPLEFLNADIKIECIYSFEKIIIRIRKTDSLKSFDIDLKTDDIIDDDLIMDLIRVLNDYMNLDYIDVNGNIVNINKVITSYYEVNMKGVEF